MVRPPVLDGGNSTVAVPPKRRPFVPVQCDGIDGSGNPVKLTVCFSMLAGELLLRLGITHGTLLLFGAISFFAFAIFALVYQD